MFSKEVLNLFSNPIHAGKIIKPEGKEDCYNSNKTEHVEFALRIENGIIKECKFRAQAEPQIIACCEKVATLVENKPANMILIDANSVANQLNVDVDSVNFCINCVTGALNDYKTKLAKAQKQ